MYLDIKKIKQLLANDKRKCDRLKLPAKISHNICPSAEWIWPLDAANIGGGGLSFISGQRLSKGRRLKLKIEFPDLKAPLLVNGSIAWCRKLPQKKSSKSKKQLPLYEVGIRFSKKASEDRRRFVLYLSEKIFNEYLTKSA